MLRQKPVSTFKIVFPKYFCSKGIIGTGKLIYPKISSCLILQLSGLFVPVSETQW